MPRNRAMLAHQLLASPRLAPGSAARDRVFQRLSPEARATFSGTVLPSSWIDEWHAVELHRAIRVALELTDDEAFKEYYRKAQVVAYSRVFKFLLAFASPALMLSRSPSVWKKQHDTGELVVDEVKDASARGRVVGDPCATDPDYSLCILAGMEAALGLTGARPVTGERRIVSSDVLEVSLRWTPR